jgi:hypothetical protein
MSSRYNHRKKRRQIVERIIITLEEILGAEELHNKQLPAHPSFEDQVANSDEAMFYIDEALDNLRSAYYS